MSRGEFGEKRGERLTLKRSGNNKENDYKQRNNKENDYKKGNHKENGCKKENNKDSDQGTTRIVTVAKGEGNNKENDYKDGNNKKNVYKKGKIRKVTGEQQGKWPKKGNNKEINWE